MIGERWDSVFFVDELSDFAHLSMLNKNANNLKWFRPYSEEEEGIKDKGKGRCCFFMCLVLLKYAQNGSVCTRSCYVALDLTYSSKARPIHSSNLPVISVPDHMDIHDVVYSALRSIIIDFYALQNLT